jgi:hypothetical protein
MAKLHHATKKTAVTTYSTFHTAGASEAEVKSEIAKDAKEFDDEAINEIYQGILDASGSVDDSQDNSEEDGKSTEETTGKGKKKKHIVVSPFRDIHNFDNQNNPGDDVSHFDKDRLERLVKSGLVELK